MIKSVKVSQFSFLKIITIFFLLHKNSNPRHKHAKWPPSDLTSWTLTLILTYKMYVNVKQWCVKLRSFPLKMDRLFFKTFQCCTTNITQNSSIPFWFQFWKHMPYASEKVGKFATFLKSFECLIKMASLFWLIFDSVILKCLAFC